jgi:RHS repeat-associated protein
VEPPPPAITAVKTSPTKAKAIVNYDFPPTSSYRQILLTMPEWVDAQGRERPEAVLATLRGAQLQAAGPYTIELDVPNGAARYQISVVVSYIDQSSDCYNEDYAQTQVAPTGGAISLVEGNMSLATVDPLPPILGTALVRRYDSAYGEDGFFGRGWMSIFDQQMQWDWDIASVRFDTLSGGYIFTMRGPVIFQLDQVSPEDPLPATAIWHLELPNQFVSLRPAGSSVESWYDELFGRFMGMHDVASGHKMSVTPASVGSGFIVEDSRSGLTWTVVVEEDLIRSITATSGLTWTYEYDSDRNLTRVAGPGNVTWQTYEYQEGLLSAVRDAAGKLVQSRTYDALGRVKTATSPVETITNIDYGLSGPTPEATVSRVTVATGGTTDVTFGPKGATFKTTEADGACLMCGPQNTVTTYDDKGRPVRQQTADGYVSVSTYTGGRITRRDLRQRLSDCDPQLSATLCKVTAAQLESASLVPSTAARTLQYEFNDATWPDKPTAIETASIVNSSGTVREELTYDAATGQVLTRSVSGWTGAPAVQQTRTVTTLPYDGTEGAAFDPGLPGVTGPQPRLPKTVDGARTDVPDVTTFVYYPIGDGAPPAARGRIAAVKNALGQITKFENYDLFGNARRVTDVNGVTIELTTDSIGRVLTHTLKGSPGCDAAADPLCATDLVTTNTYDGLGPILREERADGSVTLFTYDDRGRLSTASVGPDADHLKEQSETIYAASGKVDARRYLQQSGGWRERRTEGYAYTPEGYLQKVVHPDTSFLEHTYDRAGRVTATKDENHPTANRRFSYDASGQVARAEEQLGLQIVSASYSYDGHGNLKTATDPNANTTTFIYDDFGQLLKEVSPFSGTTSYVYDIGGNVVTRMDANDVATTSTYDALGRAVSRTWSRPDVDSETVTWSYDTGPFSTGRLVGMTDPTGATTYQYERRGSLLREEKRIGATTYATSFQYDKQGHRSRVVYPSGAVVAYTNDYVGRPVSATWNGVPLVTSAAYEPFGPPSEITYGNGTTRTIAYDKRYRPQGNTLSGSQGVLAAYEYEHDHVGNVTWIRDARASGYNRNFVYDELHRLTRADTGAKLWGAGEYEYDHGGNVLESALGNTARHFGYGLGAKRPVTVTENGTTSAVTYDAAGNEIGVGGETSTVTARNLLGSTDQFVYSYDGRGIRTITTPRLGLTAVVLSPSSVTGGGTVSGSITVSAPVVRDTAIAVMSSAEVATVPRTVTIPAGSNSGTFTIATSAVAEVKEAVVRASWLGTTASATLTIAPPAAFSLQIGPATVTGGSGSTGTVALGQARDAAFAVALHASGASVGVPASVTIPAGATNVTFPITTTPVAAATGVTITATAGTVSAERTLTVLPPVLDLLALDKASLYGSETTDALVTLTGPAPAGGVVVSLTSDKAAVTVPSSVTIPPAATQAAFVVATAPVDVQVAATIAASAGGVERSGGVVVLPAALKSLALAPASARRGEVVTATVSLNGPAGPSGTTVQLSSSNPTVVASPGPVAIAAGQVSGAATFAPEYVTEGVVVVLTASHRETTRAASLVVKPPILSLELVSESIDPVTGYGEWVFEVRTVEDHGGMTTVALDVSGANWEVPPSVDVPFPPGSAQFTARHPAPEDAYPVVITATLGYATAEWRFPQDLRAESNSAPRTEHGAAPKCASLALIPCLTSAGAGPAVLSPLQASRYSLYDSNLHLMAESAISSASPKPIQYEYVWFSNLPIAQIGVPEGSITWTFTDHLGAPVIQTDSGGNVVWRAEYEPSGRIYQLRAGEGRHQPLRLPGQDAEQFDDMPNGNSDRSYNIARWYRPGWGRFLSVDPKERYDATATPQLWNRYAYALNNPLRMVDPDGKEPKAFLLVTGKPLDPIRHSAIHIRDDDAGRNLDLVYSHGGQASGVSPLRDYLSAYNPTKDPTTAYELNMEPSEVAALKANLDSNYTITNGRYVSDVEYKSVSNNCAQFTCQAVTQSADLNVFQKAASTYVNVTNQPVLTVQLINFFTVTGLINPLAGIPAGALPPEAEKKP